MINERNLRFIINIFGDDYHVADRDKGEILYYCPFCKELGHHTKNRKLYVNTNKLRYICFRCGSHGSLSREISSDFNSVDIKSVLSKLLDDNIKDDEEETTYFPIPKDKLVDCKDSLGYEYMKSRGFTDELMDKYNFRLPGLDSNLFGRIVVPNQVISKNWSDFYIARAYDGNKIRYKNPNNSRKSELLFNYQNIPNNPEIMILNEGMLNSIIAGDNSIASFGKQLSICQRDMIISKHPNHLYVSYDTDAISQSIKVCESIKALSDIHVHLVILPEELKSDGSKKGLDAVDLGHDKYMDIVMNTPEFINKNMFNILNWS